jgi:hypothetical protein
MALVVVPHEMSELPLVQNPQRYLLKRRWRELIREVLLANAVGGVITIGCLLIGVRGIISEYLRFTSSAIVMISSTDMISRSPIPISITRFVASHSNISEPRHINIEHTYTLPIHRIAPHAGDFFLVSLFPFNGIYRVDHFV